MKIAGRCCFVRPLGGHGGGGVAAAHSPVLPKATPSRAAAHSFGYVLSLQPHTGLYCWVHISGIGLQIPDWSAAPQCASTGNAQYRPGAQPKPAMPPHMAPAGPAFDGAGCAGSAGADADADGVEGEGSAGVAGGGAFVAQPRTIQ